VAHTVWDWADHPDRQFADCGNQRGLGLTSSGSSRTSAVSLLNVFWGVGAVLCSLMVAWTAAHKVLPFLSRRGGAAPGIAGAGDAQSTVSSGGNFHGTIGFLARDGEESGDLLFAAVFFLYPGAETAVGGWIGSYVSRLERAGRRWRR